MSNENISFFRLILTCGSECELQYNKLWVSYSNVPLWLLKHQAEWNSESFRNAFETPCFLLIVCVELFLNNKQTNKPLWEVSWGNIFTPVNNDFEWWVSARFDLTLHKTWLLRVLPTGSLAQEKLCPQWQFFPLKSIFDTCHCSLCFKIVNTNRTVMFVSVLS